MFKRLYQILDRPWLYRLAGKILVLGGGHRIRAIIEQVVNDLPPAGTLLDVGCGPRSRLAFLGHRPTGVDLTAAYLREYTRLEAPGVVGSADALPFPHCSFDGVWSVFLLHHLPDTVAARAVSGMIDVCKPGGYVVIVDGVVPDPEWRHPMAAAVRRLDRGRFMRRQKQIEALLPDRTRWSVQRRIYSQNGMEMLICQFRKGHQSSVSVPA